jgi:hypothetical protein
MLDWYLEFIFVPDRTAYCFNLAIETHPVANENTSVAKIAYLPCESVLVLRVALVHYYH